MHCTTSLTDAETNANHAFSNGLVLVYGVSPKSGSFLTMEGPIIVSERESYGTYFVLSRSNTGC
jgi:hypothetical protein